MDKNRVGIVFLGILTVIVVGAVLKFAQSVFVPLIIAWLFSYILGPVVKSLTKRRVPTGLSVFFVLILLLTVVYVVTIFLYARIAVFAAAYPKYQERLTELVTTIGNQWDVPQYLLAGIDWGEKVGAFLGDLAGSLVSFLSSLVMVMVFLVFMLLGKPFFGYKIRKAFSPAHGEKITKVMSSIANQIGRYLSAQFLISLSTGVCVWLALRLIGVDFAVTWGALAFFLNFIPSIGSVIATIPPVLLALVQFYPSYWPCIITLVVLLTIQMIIGNGISPKIMGDKLNLSPVVVLLSLVFWGWLWGVVGALLSTPIASTIKLVCENIEPLRPISIMMGSGKTYRAEFEKME